MSSESINNKLLVFRSVLMVVFGLFFIVAPFVLPLSEGRPMLKWMLPVLGALIIVIDAWGWVRRKRDG